MIAAPRIRPPALRHAWVRALLIGVFVWLVGRHWHPYYGFTRFLQLDEISAATTLPELRAAPLFTYEYGYDGHYYAQLAARPAVNDPALSGAIDNVGYRARRILLSWVAWLVGLGDPVAAVRAYAWLNLPIWAGLAVLLWRIFPGATWRETLAWGAVLFSAGVLHSVRLALTDALALLAVGAATYFAAQTRRGPAATWLAAGGLARETVLLAAVTLLPAKRGPRADWLRAAGWGALVAAPWVAWLLYLRSVIGPPQAGVHNFALPLVGWTAKWREVWATLHHEPDRYLAVTTLLAHVAVTVQAAYLVRRPQWTSRWWRVGAVYAVLLCFLGMAVWQGHPGAVARVVLPLTLAFNVLAVADKAGIAWLGLGNLSVLSGVLVFWAVPTMPGEVASGRYESGAYVARVDARWYPTEGGPGRAWAWNPGDGGVRIELSARTDEHHRVRVALHSPASRPLQIKESGRVVWSGEIGSRSQWIELPDVHFTQGRAVLELHTDVPPMKESATAGGRALGFALSGVKVD